MASAFWTLLRVLRERAGQERSCRWTRPQLEAHQRRSLAALRQFALAHSPFYREFHRGLESQPLEALPVLSKGLLMERFDDLVTDRRIRLNDAEAHLRCGDTRPYLGRYVVLATSGSTGRRGVFVFDDKEWIRAIASITRPIAWFQAPGASRRPPRAALIAANAPWHYSARIGRALANRVAPALRLDAATPLSELVARLNDWQPTALATYPSVLRALAGEQLAGRLRLAPANIATSAEVLTAEVRSLVRQAWSIEVQNTYGATEYAPIASQCLAGRMHLFENGAQIEVVDERGRAVPAHERGARLLLSVFDRRTQPLIRYEISDLVKVSDEVCPCGRPYRVIEAIEGREEDILEFPRAGAGTASVHPNQFHDALEGAAVGGWQVEQTATGLLARVIGGDDAAVLQLRGALERILASHGIAGQVIEVVPVIELPRGASGKAPLVIGRRMARPAAPGSAGAPSP